MIRLKISTEAGGRQGDYQYYADTVKATDKDKEFVGARWTLGNESIGGDYYYTCTANTHPGKKYSVYIVRWVGNSHAEYIYADALVAPADDDDDEPEESDPWDLRRKNYY